MSNQKNDKRFVEVQITYCVEWGYLKRASGLGAEIEKEFLVKVNLIDGHEGIFEVAINDHVIYSNFKEEGRLPEPEEIIERIREYHKSKW